MQCLLEYDTVEQQYSYSNPKDLLLRLDGDIILLDTCGATQSLIKDVENHMEEELAARGWADVSVNDYMKFMHCSSRLMQISCDSIAIGAICL